MKDRKELPMRKEVTLINNRLDSHSKRITNVATKMSRIISNQEHYLKKRLPSVLKRAKAQEGFATELEKAKRILVALERQRFTFVSNSKDEHKRKDRYIGLFTHVEMQRLRRLLEANFAYIYMLYRKDKFPKLQNKHLMFLDKSEKTKLRKILKEKT